MTHRNAPLTVVGRQRAVTQVVDVGRPIAHVAAEFHIARATLSKWVSRYRDCGGAGLEDRSSAPAERPSRLAEWVVELIEHWRRKRKWSARRIARELADRHSVPCRSEERRVGEGRGAGGAACRDIKQNTEQ